MARPLFSLFCFVLGLHRVVIMKSLKQLYKEVALEDTTFRNKKRKQYKKAGVITQNIYQHKILLGNEQRRKNLNFSLKYLKLRKTSGLSQASESTQICATRVFFLSLLSFNLNDQLSQNVHRIFHFMITQVRILVFDNYQTCPAP